jgi:hypothetical protein
LVEEEEPEAAEATIVAEVSTISKGKHRAAPAKTKVFSKVYGLVSHSAKVIINTQPTHNAHSVTGALHGRQSQSVLLHFMSGTAKVPVGQEQVLLEREEP